MYKPKETGGKVISRGSFMGEQFADMFSQDKETNIKANFLSFASGQEVIRRATGKLAPVAKPRKNWKRKIGAPKTPWNFGDKEANYQAAREKLNEAMSKATHGLQKQWPGKSTSATLKKLGVTFCIKENDLDIGVNQFCGKPGAMQDKQLQKILRAFHKDLVVLTGPPAPDAPDILGADPNKDEPSGVNEVTPSNPTSSNKRKVTRATRVPTQITVKEKEKGSTAGTKCVKPKTVKKKGKQLTTTDSEEEEEEEDDEEEEEEDKEEDDDNEEDTNNDSIKNDDDDENNNNNDNDNEDDDNNNE
ncbi:hypothetical protein PTTG_05580 [Puccinia triticina 1-1 BBBD Race 1]|uniref:Uncharacterized protein n=1 Tax=Puccinia triticina (isolate 1-1 / race 1 (BBBD)) TaxID=630390 RepID=A0A0C4EXN1_PUCT1|nr:hypothetical protein PTTG_05580 [Puccinia triticina 1-1 BBBD Race 1]